VLVWTLICLYVIGVFVVAGWFAFRAFGETPAAPPGQVCTDSGIESVPNGQLSAAECHPG
jgi:hypothetical protein